MEDHREDMADPASFNSTTDICEQLLHRYEKSSAPQHRHLVATAAATRSILTSESLPLTPFSYFAATISTLSDSSNNLDTNALAALSSFLSIVLPLVPDNSISPSKAAEGIIALLDVLKRQGKVDEAALGTSSARALVKCLGVLVGFCDSDDWDSVQLGFQALLRYSIDKRPKVRKCAQDCLLTVFKSFGSSVSKKASKLVYSLLKDHIYLAVKMNASNSPNESKVDILSKPEHQEVLHVLNVLKFMIPYLSSKLRSKVLSELLELMTSQFSAMTRHIFDIIRVIFDTLNAEVIIADLQNIIKMLVTYISMGDKNPVDTLLSAATLAKSAIDKLHTSETMDWMHHLLSVMGSIAGLLVFEATALQASSILKEIISSYLDTKEITVNGNGAGNGEAVCEGVPVKATCSVFENMLSTANGIPSEPVLAVISVLFSKLGCISDIYMKDILLKLANCMTAAPGSSVNRIHVEECIGSAIVAMGPEKLLSLLPISLSEDLSCTNTWLIPLLRRYVVGSSLGFYMHNVVPLAESLQKASRKVKKSVIGEDLQAYAHGLWGLLPAFCRYPTDITQNFGALVKVLMRLIKKDSFMLENIAIALQELVNQNRSLVTLTGSPGLSKELPVMNATDLITELKVKSSFTKKAATKNVKALALCSEELLQALSDVFFDAPPSSREILKDSICCLASITKSSVTRKIFVSSLNRLQLTSDSSGGEVLELHITFGEKENSGASMDKRCLILELASSIVEGADEDLVNVLFNIVQKVLEATDGIGHVEAYQTLSKILEKHSWFCSANFDGLVDILLGARSSADVPSLKSRLACIQTLLILALQENLDEENTKAFIILNEIILMSKDSKDEARKAAYDALVGISISLRNSSCATPEGPYHKLITMVMAYLSGSSPHIKSGAVSALSIMVYNHSDICLTMPDLVPSILSLLQLKAVEVIKAVLGFIKVLVSSLETKDLLKFAADIVDGILPWSSMSRHHFRSKVTVILEIMMRKCGTGAVKAWVPEKYRVFFRNVSENRHGKPSSNDASTADSEAKHPNMSSGRLKKTKHTESAVTPEEGGFAGARKRKRDDKQGGFVKRSMPHSRAAKPFQRAKQPGHKAKGGPPQQRRDKNNSTSDRWSAGGKRKERTGGGAPPPKFQKHIKLAKKRQKMN